MIRVFMVGYSRNKGGVESYISNLCNNLDKNKYEIIYSMPQMQIDGKTWIAPPNRHNYIKYFCFWTEFYKKNHFDVLYYNTCDIVCIDQLKFAKAAGVSIRIIHSHSTGIQQKINLFHRIFEKQSRKVLDRYVTNMFACSKVAGDWMFDGRSYEIIKNGIQLSKYQFSEKKRIKIRKKFGYKDETVVGIIGRIAAPKNPFFTVRVLEILLKKKDIRAVFVGDGEQRTEVEAAVKKADLGEKIRFMGAVDNVNEWMSAIDCLLMPSLFEGLPFVLVEAQAAGLPCVVSSAVSKEADLTGLIDFVSLEESLEVWAERVIKACSKTRQDTNQQLIDAGYSIEETARIVTDIIENSF